MATSQNSWSANDRSVIASYGLPGGKVALRAGDASVVLLWLAHRFHDDVEELEWPGNWGYAERPIRGSTTTLSNHASGTALDLNAPQHPLGTAPSANFTSAQIRTIGEIVGHCDGVVRWGGSYSGRKDGMHFELVAGAAAVAAVADKLRAQATAPAHLMPAPRPRSREDDVVYLKCQPDPRGPVWTALLSGPMFVGLGPTEAPSDAQIREMGAVVQWVERGTWEDFDARSKALCAVPRPVIVTNMPAPTPSPAK